MRNNQVVPAGRVITNSGRCVSHVEHIFRVGNLYHLFAAGHFLNFNQGVVDRLAPGQVGDGAGHDDGNANWLNVQRFGHLLAPFFGHGFAGHGGRHVNLPTGNGRFRFFSRFYGITRRNVPVIHHQAAIFQRQLVRRAAQFARLVFLNDVQEDAIPFVKLRGDDNIRRQAALVRLGANPGDARLFGYANRPHHLLRRTGQHVCACLDVGIGRFGRQRRIAKGTSVGNVYCNVRVGRLGASHKTVNVQFGVPRFYRPHHADDAGFRHIGRQNAVDVPPLLGAGFVSKDVVQAGLFTRIGGRAPGKAGLREVGRNLKEGGAVLRAVRNDNVVPVGRVVPDSGRCVGHVEHIFRVGDLHHLFAAGVCLNAGQRVVNGLTPGQVGDGAGHNNGNADWLDTRGVTLGRHAFGRFFFGCFGRLFFGRLGRFFLGRFGRFLFRRFGRFGRTAGTAASGQRHP